MKSRQDQFDTVVLGLGKQGKPAMNGTGNCFYRAPDGAKCAAGQLIPDKLYKREMEGNSICRVILDNPVLKDFVDEDLGMDLQDAHDWYWYDRDKNEMTTRKFVERLHMLAGKYTLNPAVIAQAFPGVR